VKQFNSPLRDDELFGKPLATAVQAILDCGKLLANGARSQAVAD
jgi:hypothetical protein